jgi:hypothetical protein
LKRAILILSALALVACAGCAQEIIVADSVTLYWDAVTTDSNGDPLLPIDIVEYDGYLDDGMATDPQDIAQLTYLGRVAVAQMAVTPPNRAVWYLGVRAVVTTGGVPVYSLISWSTEEPPITQTGPFAVVPGLDGVPKVEQLRAE